MTMTVMRVIFQNIFNTVDDEVHSYFTGLMAVQLSLNFRWRMCRQFAEATKRQTQIVTEVS